MYSSPLPFDPALLVEPAPHDPATDPVAVLTLPAPAHFSVTERETLHRLLAARRDVRHFVPGAQITPEVRARLLHALHTAPSVGLMQPWRFVRITSAARRAALARLVDAERARTAAALGERAAAFLTLKVEGVRECAELWVALVAPEDGSVIGRRSMPREMALCSVACAIENLWLAARAENLGMGWVSMIDPQALAAELGLADGSAPLGLLCIGPAQHQPDAPLFETLGWRARRPVGDFLVEEADLALSPRPHAAGTQQTRDTPRTPAQAPDAR